MSERWKPVPGFAGYEVSNIGRVRSWRLCGRHKRGAFARSTPVIRKLQPNVLSGYLYVMFSAGGRRKMYAVHLLVIRAFRGPSRGREARHKNGHHTDNRLANLIYGTRRDQFEDQCRHGTDTRGERNGSAKFTNVQARTIRARLARGERGRDLAAELHVAESTICRIKKGVRYASA